MQFKRTATQYGDKETCPRCSHVFIPFVPSKPKQCPHCGEIKIAQSTTPDNVNYANYLAHTPAESGGQYYRLDIPVGILPPKEGTKISLLGKTCVVFDVSTADDIARGRGGPTARDMRKNGIGYLVNCLPEGHEYLK